MLSLCYLAPSSSPHRIVLPSCLQITSLFSSVPSLWSLARFQSLLLFLSLLPAASGLKACVPQAKPLEPSQLAFSAD